MKTAALCAMLALVALPWAAAAQQGPTAIVNLGPEPEDPLDATKRLMLDTLRDPDSAQYRFIGLHPARCKNGWLSGKGGWEGYAATIEINAANALGGKTGFHTFTILFANGSAIRAIDGENFGAYGPSKGVLGIGGGAGVCRWLDH